MYLSSCIKMTAIHNSKVGTITEMHKEIVGGIELWCTNDITSIAIFLPKDSFFKPIIQPLGI